jgi:hypothetical protein
MEGVMEEAVKTGNLWIILFVALLIYFVKDSKSRETKYTEMIEKSNEIIKSCSVNCEINKEIKVEIGEIKQFAGDIKKDTENIKNKLTKLEMNTRKKNI